MLFDIALHFFLECSIFFAVFFQVLRFMKCFKPLSHNRIGRFIHISNLATQCVCLFGILIYIFKRLKLKVAIAIIADIFGAFFKHFFKFIISIFSVKGNFQMSILNYMCNPFSDFISAKFRSEIKNNEVFAIVVSQGAVRDFASVTVIL